MSDDEIAVGIAAGLVAALFWGGWLYSALPDFCARPSRPPPGRPVGVVLVAMGIVAVALVTGADPLVRTSPGYIVLFLAVAAATLAVATVAGSAFGLSARSAGDSGAEPGGRRGGRRTVAGTGLVNAGANVGRGDTIYTTLGPLTLALAALVGLTGILAAATDGFRVRPARSGRPGGRPAGWTVRGLGG